MGFASFEEWWVVDIPGRGREDARQFPVIESLLTKLRAKELLHEF
jgi:hypothetical protein